MRIHILDPGFIRPVGHHVEWDLLIARELVRRGHQVHLFCHTEAAEESMQAFSKYGQVTPLFQHDPYVGPANPVHELSLYLDVATITASQLRQLPPADLWLWPSLYASHLLSCAMANPGIPIAGLMHLEPTARLPYGDVWWAYAFEKAALVRLDLRLSVTTVELQQLYARFTKRYAIKCVPIAQEGLLASAPKKQLKKIGLFGDQRQEKGFSLLPELLSRLLAEGYEVILQDSRGLPQIGDAPNLTRLGYVENFAQALAQCDLVVLPYNPVDYRYRLSGVAAEALASGVPIVAPAGTPSERLVRETGAGVLFPEYTAESIFGAVCDARERYAGLAEAAFNTSRTWDSKHGPRHFVGGLLGGATA